MATAKHPHVKLAEQYIADVVAGRIVAGALVVLACKRQLRDIERSRAPDFPYRFDLDAAEKVCRFIELCPHVKGEWQGRRIVLDAWQAFFVTTLFGWVHKATGRRRFRKARLYCSRKNGKSTLVAPIGLFMFTADGEPGAEVYSGATSEKQAWEVFGPMRLMAKKTQALLDRFQIEVNAKSLIRLEDASKAEPIIGDPGDGASPHCSITDEYHEHKTDTQVSTMETGMGSRRQPLSVIVSTAGEDIAGPCFDDWDMCRKVLQGLVDDDELFALIYAMDPEDDWTSEVALRKANPGYGVSIYPEFLQRKQREAINNPRKAGTFKTKHLNVWVQAREAYIDMEAWAKCLDSTLRIENFHGASCWIGLDLASKIDLASMVLIFEMPGGKYAIFGKHYLPRARVKEEHNKHYQGWEKQGYLTVTEGEMIDFEVIEADILDASRNFHVESLAFDPNQATYLMTRLSNEGVAVIEVRPTTLNFSEPMKQLDGEIRSGKLLHNGDPVMAWAFSNVTAKPNGKDEVYPRKERDENKIDPFVAACMAKGRNMAGIDTGLEDFLREPIIG